MVETVQFINSIITQFRVRAIHQYIFHKLSFADLIANSINMCQKQNNYINTTKDFN